MTTRRTLSAISLASAALAGLIATLAAFEGIYIRTLHTVFYGWPAFGIVFTGGIVVLTAIGVTAITTAEILARR